ncbi:MAG: SDR family NAD(P)-dependent oxidoreductase, partial [Microcystaceae cyanobacterium]
MSDSLPQQRVIITGASSGIGRATALAFAQRGFAVALLGRSPTRLAAVTEQILSQGGQAQAYTLDLTDWEQLPQQFTAIARDWGTPDILVNSAGMGYTNPLKD